MADNKLTRVLGIIYANVFFYIFIFEVKVISYKLLSKIIKVAVASELIRQVNKNKNNEVDPIEIKNTIENDFNFDE